MNKYDEALSKFDLNLNEKEISNNTAEIIEKYKSNFKPEVLRFLFSCIDMTSLNTDDSRESIWRFTEKINDLDNSKPGVKNVAAICVFPNFVSTVKEALTADVRIAAVAGGFPSSQTFPEIKVAEAALAIKDGADEIDIVLNIGEFIDGNWVELSEEIEEIKTVCGDNVLKVIIETGLLKTPSNIRKATILSMYSGADFIKTSTGKIFPGATPEAVYIICQTIKEYYKINDKKIGIKISGGIRTADDAVKYYSIVKEVLGNEWLNPNFFRIGASSLIDDLLEKI